MDTYNATYDRTQNQDIYDVSNLQSKEESAKCYICKIFEYGILIGQKIVKLSNLGICALLIITTYFTETCLGKDIFWVGIEMNKNLKKTFERYNASEGADANRQIQKFFMVSFKCFTLFKWILSFITVIW